MKSKRIVMTALTDEQLALAERLQARQAIRVSRAALIERAVELGLRVLEQTGATVTAEGSSR
jgi:hypothetical protein